MGCVTLGTPNPADPLLDALHMPTEHWLKRALLIDSHDGTQTWSLYTYETPVMENALCTSHGKSWTIKRDLTSGTTTAQGETTQRLVYFGPSTGLPCESIPSDRYSWVGDAVDVTAVPPLLANLTATSRCAVQDMPACGHWHNVNVTPDAAARFQDLPGASVFSVYRDDDSKLNVLYKSSASTTVALHCVVTRNADGSRDLNISAPPSALNR